MMHTCPCCHTEVDTLHKHHILPKVLGGVDAESNIINCCELCHGKIHGRDMVHHSVLTREGLRKAKARGVKLGGARPNNQARHDAVKALADAKAKEIKPMIEQCRNDGLSYRKIADKLNEANVPTAQGGKWYASTVLNYNTRGV